MKYTYSYLFGNIVLFSFHTFFIYSTDAQYFPLFRMRDLSAHDKHELQRLQKDMETKKTEFTELNRTREKLASQVAQLEQTISDLQEQVCSLLSSYWSKEKKFGYTS